MLYIYVLFKGFAKHTFLKVIIQTSNFILSNSANAWHKELILKIQVRFTFICSKQYFFFFSPQIPKGGMF